MAQGTIYRALALLLGLLPLEGAYAQSTVKYVYDALGRLVAVRHEGGANDQVSVVYHLDKAGNRTNVVVGPTGSVGPPVVGDESGGNSPTGKRFVVVPSGVGYALIFLD